jgi:hypothetical protein
MDLRALCRIRPYIYHLTSSINVPKIRREGTLYSSAELLSNAPERLLRKRGTCLSIEHNGEQVHIRDQAPLYAGNVRLEGGWAFADLLRALNERVFFWPGSSAGPISYGVRHFLRYREESPHILRMLLVDLMIANPTSPPQFCRFNSGSPRCSQGRGSLRGPSTFLGAEEADFPPSSVVEVTFLNRVTLPPCIELAVSPGGPWAVL